jgi:antitoxin component YwqK of YwqJK toxin-antitoxin module
MLSSKVYYIANDERDTSNYYYINGNLKRRVIMDAQGKAIKEFVYDFGGWLSTVRVKIDDKIYSETTYFANGKLEAEFIYNGSDLKDGTYSVYYDNGKLKRQFTVLNGKTSGASKSYFEDGSPNIYSNYINGLFEGSYTAYYKGGVMKEKSTYTKGKQTGEYEEYYESGKLSEKGLYGAKTKEDLTKYAENGNIYGIMKLKDNVPTHLKFMDDANNVVYEKEDASGLYNYPLFYSNGVKAVDMKINENGRREGLLSFYYSTSAKSEDCNYKDGDLVGKSTSYFKDGKLKSEANYVKDQLDGYYRLLFYNGQTNLEGWYKEGKKQGEWISYSVNGKIESDKYYQDDEFNGYLKQYNINGELRDKYIYQFGMPVGIVCYDTSGLIVTDSIYFGNKNGKIGFTHDPLKKTKDGEFTIHGGSFDGEVKFWYANGQLKKHEFFKMGKRDSTSIFYYPDGKVKTKGTYLNGEKVGKWLNYNELGELVKEDNFNNYGEVDGDMFGYANKILHVKYHFNKGNIDGEQTYYGENGRIAFKLIYEKGDLVAYTYEGKDGKMLPPIKLKNGSGKMICYYSNGTKSGEAEFDQNAIKNGLRVYFTNGKLAEERNYRNFDLYGDFKRYNPDGTLVYEAVYKDDEILGKEKTYDNAGKLVIDADYYYGEYQGITRVTNTASSKTVNYHYHYGTLTKSN